MNRCKLAARHSLQTRSSLTGGREMPLWTPDPTFYPSPKMAMEAPSEKVAFVSLLSVGNGNGKDALGVVDTDQGSSTYGQIVGKLEMPHGDNELHHFGWNACKIGRA